jgi:hypothetical protein
VRHREIDGLTKQRARFDPFLERNVADQVFVFTNELLEPSRLDFVAALKAILRPS